MSAHIIAAARAYMGVPFLHQGRNREFGIDCAGLVILVGRDIGAMAPDFDVNGYDRFRDGTMQPACDQHLDRADEPALGCVVMMRFAREPQHLAIIADYRHGGLSVVHALEESGGVVEHRLDSTWRSRIVQAYRYRGDD